MLGPRARTAAVLPWAENTHGATYATLRISCFLHRGTFWVPICQNLTKSVNFAYMFSSICQQFPFNLLKRRTLLEPSSKIPSFPRWAICLPLFRMKFARRTNLSQAPKCIKMISAKDTSITITIPVLGDVRKRTNPLFDDNTNDDKSLSSVFSE